MAKFDFKATARDGSISTGTISAADRNAAFGHPYHVRICGADYPGRIASAGFEVSVVSSTAMSSHRRRFWRISKTVLFDCLRQN